MFNILVVEDNINNMRLFKQILSDVEKEMTITDAYTGNEAIEKSKNYVYDLVLMDIALPDMGGVETRRELIKDSNFSKTIFIAVTAHASAEDKENLEKEFDYYLSKPIDEEQMISLIDELLK